MSNKNKRKNTVPEIKPVDYTADVSTGMDETEKKTESVALAEGATVTPSQSTAPHTKTECCDSVGFVGCDDKCDITKGNRIPSGFLLETDKPKRCIITIRLTSGTNYQMVMHTLINDNNYIGHPLAKKICTTKLIPMEFTKVISCNAEKVHVFYSAIK